MSKSFLRLIDVNGSEFSEEGVNTHPHQLSLFDDYLYHKVLCFSMVDIHGEYFARSFVNFCPKFVLDLRKFPYFDLLTLHKDDVFRIFLEVGAEYCHRPIEFRNHNSSKGKWEFRQSVFDLFDDLSFISKSMDGSIAVLLNNRDEAEEFSLALRPVKAGSICWKLSIL